LKNKNITSFEKVLSYHQIMVQLTLKSLQQFDTASISRVRTANNHERNGVTSKSR